MVERGEGGKLKKGSVLNPNGRPKRTDEESYNAVLVAVATPDRFKTALEKQMAKAERGDLDSFKYVCKLLGLEVENKNISGTLSVVIDWDEPEYNA